MFVVILSGSVSFDMTSVVVAIQPCFTYDLVCVSELSPFTLFECSLKFIFVATVEIIFLLSFVFKELLLAVEQSRARLRLSLYVRRLRKPFGKRRSIWSRSKSSPTQAI